LFPLAASLAPHKKSSKPPHLVASRTELCHLCTISLFEITLPASSYFSVRCSQFNLSMDWHRIAENTLEPKGCLARKRNFFNARAWGSSGRRRLVRQIQTKLPLRAQSLFFLYNLFDRCLSPIDATPTNNRHIGSNRLILAILGPLLEPHPPMGTTLNLPPLLMEQEIFQKSYAKRYSLRILQKPPQNVPFWGLISQHGDTCCE